MSDLSLVRFPGGDCQQHRVGTEDLPRGTIIDAVRCRQDASQRYALYLPSEFHSVATVAGHPASDGGGRGREGVERYRAAAEKYGYVEAGPKNSRNGPWMWASMGPRR